MTTIEEAVRGQVNALVNDLLKQNPRLLTNLGIDRQWRKYFKAGDLKKLPPVDVVFAALILLQKEIVIEDVSIGVGKVAQYSILASERPAGQSRLVSSESVQMPLLAGFDFPDEAEATIERAERKGPNRVELLMNVRVRAAAR